MGGQEALDIWNGCYQDKATGKSLPSVFPKLYNHQGKYNMVEWEARRKEYKLGLVVRGTSTTDKLIIQGYSPYWGEINTDNNSKTV